jgi:hypothetical protein
LLLLVLVLVLVLLLLPLLLQMYLLLLLRLLQGLLMVLLLVLLCACKQRFMLLPIWRLRHLLPRLYWCGITLALLLCCINLKLQLLLLRQGPQQKPSSIG